MTAAGSDKDFTEIHGRPYSNSTFYQTGQVYDADKDQSKLYINGNYFVTIVGQKVNWLKILSAYETLKNL